MQQSGVKVQGLRSTVNAMRLIGVPDQTLKDVSRSSAEIVAVEARSLVPVRTGALRDSIRVGALKSGAVIRAGGIRIPYANPIHWGWKYDRENFIDKNIWPQPFLVRALGLKRETVIKNYFDGLKKATEDEIARQNREVR